MIVWHLLNEVEKEPLTPNNKSTVITCLMTAYLLKHLNMKKELDEMIKMLQESPKHKFSLVRIVKIGVQFFSEKPCDSIDMQPIIYVKYNPTLIKMANELL